MKRSLTSSFLTQAILFSTIMISLESQAGCLVVFTRSRVGAFQTHSCLAAEKRAEEQERARQAAEAAAAAVAAAAASESNSSDETSNIDQGSSVAVENLSTDIPAINNVNLEEVAQQVSQAMAEVSQPTEQAAETTTNESTQVNQESSASNSEEAVEAPAEVSQAHQEISSDASEQNVVAEVSYDSTDSLQY